MPKNPSKFKYNNTTHILSWNPSNPNHDLYEILIQTHNRKGLNSVYSDGNATQCIYGLNNTKYYVFGRGGKRIGIKNTKWDNWSAPETIDNSSKKVKKSKKHK